MKHFYLILTLASLVGASVPVSAQISIDEVNAERRNVTFRDRLKSTSVDADYFSLARYKASAPQSARSATTSNWVAACRER